jgi:DNA-binding transcriptional regulator YiaG
MTADDVLRRYPGETLRWLRGRLVVSQEVLAGYLGTSAETIARWEDGRHAVSPAHRARLAALLAPHLATPEGEAFAGSLGRGEGDRGG